jgi:nitric oxide dioxygenase
LSPKTIEIVKATAPVLEIHGLAIVRRMYERMFENPAIKDLFNQSHQDTAGSQPKAVAGAILAYANNIERLEVLAPAVERIAQKHAGLQIQPEHYPHVAAALLGAIQDVLGDAATPDVLAAWGEAYWFLADILIGREKEIYRAAATAPGGWAGWREFVIAGKQRESEVITSFLLKPKDGGAVLRHRPGQYLTFWLDIPGEAPIKRNYSISSAPGGEHYRISVKRDGLASSWLHDRAEVGTTLKVAAPAGEFFLPESPQGPIVLLSGGVGLTPMVSMLHTVAAHFPTVDVHYVHGTQNGATHAMKQEIGETVAQNDNIQSTIFYLEPANSDQLGEDYHQSGLVTAEWLKANTPIDTANYYLCGPRPFLKSLVHGLSRIGVPSARVHYEFFGPTADLQAS